jgi:hypothetical protein
MGSRERRCFASIEDPIDYEYFIAVANSDISAAGVLVEGNATVGDLYWRRQREGAVGSCLRYE